VIDDWLGGEERSLGSSIEVNGSMRAEEFDVTCRRCQASTATFNASARISSTSRSFSLTNSGAVLIL
jgi:hypothetical protein